MKVFGCKRQGGYSGGIILVVANSVEEAFMLAANDKRYNHYFDWHDENGWCAPDGKIEHVSSDTYPFEHWKEVTSLSANITTPQVILEAGYTE